MEQSIIVFLLLLLVPKSIVHFPDIKLSGAHKIKRTSF